MLGIRYSYSTISLAISRAVSSGAKVNNNNCLLSFVAQMLDCTDKICELAMNIVNNVSKKWPQ